MSVVYKSAPFDSLSKLKLNAAYTTENSLSSRWEQSFTTITSSTVPMSAIVFNRYATDIPYKEGALFYDGAEGSLVFFNDQSDLALNIGQEHWMKGINKSGVDIHNGDVVRIDGAQGDQPKFKKALAMNSENPSCAIGIATHDILANDIGYATIRGIVRGIDTRAWPEGTKLWVSSTTAGAYVTAPPSPPGVTIRAGIVVRSANDGQIYSSPLYVPNLQDLSDVDGTPVSANGQFPVWRPTLSAFDFDCNITDYLLLSTYQNASGNFVTALSAVTATNGLIVGPSNTATFYLKDSATVWEDYVIPLSQTRVGSTAPTFDQWGAGGIYVMKFDANDEVHFSAQMPHSWKCNTVVFPHVHWCQDDGTAAPGAGLSAVRWNLELAWTGIPGGIFQPSSTVTYWSTANVTGPNTQILTNIPASGIDPVSFAPYASSISSIMMMRLYRGGTGETYSGITKVVGLSFDIHYQVDSLGSENITQKYI